MSIDEKPCFDEYTFYIPNVGDGVALAGHKTNCRKCNKKIFVQLPLFGIPHHFDALAVCGECLDIDAEFKKEYPEIAEDLLKWRNS